MWHKQFMSAHIMTGQRKQTQPAYPKFLFCKRAQIKYLPVMKCILQIVVMTCRQSIAQWVSLFKRFIRASVSTVLLQVKSFHPGLAVHPVSSSTTILVQTKGIQRCLHRKCTSFHARSVKYTVFVIWMLKSASEVLFITAATQTKKRPLYDINQVLPLDRKKKKKKGLYC